MVDTTIEQKYIHENYINPAIKILTDLLEFINKNRFEFRKFESILMEDLINFGEKNKFILKKYCVKHVEFLLGQNYYYVDIQFFGDGEEIPLVLGRICISNNSRKKEQKPFFIGFETIKQNNTPITYLSLDFQRVDFTIVLDKFIPIHEEKFVYEFPDEICVLKVTELVEKSEQ